MFPPAARIFSAAARLKACTRTVSGRVISPFPKILMPAFASRTTRVSSSSSGVTTVLGSKRFSFSTLTVAYSRLKGALVKPRLGRRRCSGVWPPSKPGPLPPPARAPWPFWPRPDVLPRPEPMPRPTRLAFRRAPAGGRNSCSFISDFLHFDQVAHLEDHPANGGIVLVHHGVVETPQSQRANRVLLVLLTTDRASFPRDLQLPGHHQSPLTHDLLDGLAAQRGDLLRRAHLPQRLERGPHHVGGVVGAQRLGQHVAHAGQLQDRPHRAARDDARTGRSGLQKHLGAAEARRNLVRDGRPHQRHVNHVLAGGLHGFPNRAGHLARLAQSRTDLSGAVADHHQRGEPPRPAAFDHFRHGINPNDPLFKLRLGVPPRTLFHGSAPPLPN